MIRVRHLLRGAMFGIVAASFSTASDIHIAKNAFSVRTVGSK